MSSTNRNFIIAYILLVGVPLAGLAAVLRTGRNLAAPISVDGVWKLEADASRRTAQPCGTEIFSLSNSTLVISQSGKNLVLTFNNPAKTNASGVIDAKNLRVLMDPADSPISGCAGGQTLVLTAAVDPKSEPRSLTGVLSVNGCASCASVDFRAVRQPRSQGGH